jgi:hypothetical protein
LSQSAVRASIIALTLTLWACGSDVRGSLDADAADTVDVSGDDVADSVAPLDTVAPDTAEPDTVEPDTVTVDTEQPDTVTVDTERPDTEQPDTEQPDTVTADTTPADTEPPVDTYVPPAPAPTPGDLLITEVMIDPAGVADVFGEWIELTSLAAGDLELAGCTLTNGGSQLATLSSTAGATRVSPGARVVLGSSANPVANGGVPVDVAYAGLVLSNTAGAVVLRCDGAEIDRIDYDAAHWVILPGVALSYSASADQTAGANDDATRWCEATAHYSDSDAGTPGAANPACPPRDGEVDRCALVAPLDFSAYEGDVTTLFGRIYEAGATDQSPDIDFIYFLRAEAGAGPRGTEPAGNADWTWRDAVPTVGWDDASAPGEDQYEVDLDGLALGAYDIAFRFSLDGGLSWAHCDATPGDGTYSVADAGHLTVIDSPCVPNPCDSPPGAWCDGDVRVSYASPGGCEVDGGAPDCSYAEQHTDCAYLGGACDGGGCVGTARLPAVGELVITEIMKNPRVVFDTLGEWVELTNVSADALDLAGCTLRDNAADGHLIPTAPPLIVQPGAQIVLGKSTDLGDNGGAHVDYAYGADFNLNNTSDVVVIECGGVVIDTVTYTTSGWPNTTGASLSLDPKKTTAEGNDVGSAWCVGVLRYPDADGSEIGTPGAPNTACPEPVDRCRLVGPVEAELLDSQPFVAVGQVVEAGVTTATAGTDPDPLLLAEAGWGPANTSPISDTDWVWTPAQPDAAWSDVDAVGSDQYLSTVAAPAEAGEFDLAFRFSADGGVTWTVCDRATGTPGEDGSQNGYQLDNAGALHVTLRSACNPNPCVDPPDGVCDGDLLLTFEAPGACALIGAALDAADCDFPERTIDCALLGGSCAAGACVGAAQPPAAGAVIFDEIMRRPAAVADFFGEWVEVTNLSDAPVNLDGCAIHDDDSDLHFIDAADGALLVAPGERLVLGKDADVALNGGVVLDYAWGTDVTLGNGADELVLDCDGVVIDRVAWGTGVGLPFPASIGVAMQLTPSSFDAAANDLGALWCDATSAYGAGDLGTPGDPNAPCPAVAGVCRFQTPASATVPEGDLYTARARLRFVGLTDRTHGSDAIVGVRVDLGLGARGGVPDDTWSFTPATADPAWVDTAALGWDAWTATVPAPGVGLWDAAFRVSVDGGASWLLCDRATGTAGEDGSQDGYQPARAGQLESTPSPCTGAVCDAPPAPSCAGDFAETPSDSGSCVSGACAYPIAGREDCALRGIDWTCFDGQCVDTSPP